MAISSLPPPSPKRSRFAAVGESEAEPNPKPISKTSQTPSVSTNKGSTPKKAPNTPTPSLLTKASLSSLNRSKYVYNAVLFPPLLIICHLASRRAASPAEMGDDNESIAESTTGTIRRTEDQRIQFMMEQPDCGELEPHRAFCKRCNRWVGMGGRVRYPVNRWMKHIETCKIKESVYVSFIV